MIGYNPTIVTDGLVLYLDAANGRSYPGSGTTWSDLSGNENDGTLTNGPTYSSNNLGNFQFVTDDYVTTNFGANRNVYNNPITISVWIKPNTTSSEQIFISSHQQLGNGNFNQRLYVGINNGYLGWGILGSAWSAQGIAANTNWNMITICIDNISARFFLNTEQIYTKSVNSTFTLNHNIWFGRHDYGYYFNGLINLPMIYNRALTEDEIKRNFNATRGRFGI